MCVMVGTLAMQGSWIGFAKGVVVVESVTWRLDASGSKQRWLLSELTS